ncbi:DUF6274 family protein [Streptomyces roseolilacinus]|uniref:Uncharacterized protein n=1 Tax=Streptomyces roseolilacinus TaxID=66904 RepID=A0A918B0F3_9ACTN|nr:DUF6274 family protein [Streptomyces roseolilacinus]GGQ10729.1 hypothetical protein GCM10010249_31510 [Streptomyces roseolilacinus]
MAAATARHETRAPLRARLAAASGYRHPARRRAVRHRLVQDAVLGEQPPPVPPPAGWRARGGRVGRGDSGGSAGS